MESNTNAKLMRIFISSTDQFRHEPLYEVIVYAAKRNGLAGATVLKGVMGFGASSQMVSSARFWEITEKLPVMVEIIDESKKIEKFYEVIRPYFEKIRYGCMVTIEDVHVLMHKTGTPPKN